MSVGAEDRRHLQVLCCQTAVFNKRLRQCLILRHTQVRQNDEFVDAVIFRQIEHGVDRRFGRIFVADAGNVTKGGAFFCDET